MKIETLQIKLGNSCLQPCPECCYSTVTSYEWCNESELRERVLEHIDNNTSLIFEGGTLTACPWFDKFACSIVKSDKKKVFLVKSTEFFNNFAYFNSLCKKNNSSPVRFGVFFSSSNESKRSFFFKKSFIFRGFKNAYPIFVLGLCTQKLLWLFRDNEIYINGFIHKGNVARFPFPEKEMNEIIDWIWKNERYFRHIEFDELAIKQMGGTIPKKERNSYFLDAMTMELSHYRRPERIINLREVPFEEAVKQLSKKDDEIGQQTPYN